MNASLYASLDISVNTNSPGTEFVSGSGSIVQASGWTDLIHFSLSGISGSAQVVPSSSVLTLTSITNINTNVTPTPISLYYTIMPIQGSMSVNDVTPFEHQLAGTAFVTTDGDAGTYTITGTALDAANQLAVSNPQFNFDIHYLGQAPGYVFGAGHGTASEFDSFTYVVPEPGTWYMIAFVFVLLGFIRLCRRIRRTPLA